ncbi:hypothetical protein BKP35_05150 [Anaerobacillus arseniciselenatis]|uniref:Spore coat protein n=1 Tax=Anaerobacillus arseniciselenatis TaxID=85682 RepID=A0A1S2LU93_9BACI|nr:hypothetical protein [Anaerobacillus arseniciselenatis]OIJ15237.1 hypothetical protein BKP35_05150 [Anaerobacillus arseniciselenatis]
MSKAMGEHEKVDLHELLTFKTLCVTKSNTMMGLVDDKELQTIMQQDVQNSKRAIQQLQGFLT